MSDASMKQTGSDDVGSGELQSALASAGPRPFRVLGIQQVAIGGLDLEQLRALWVDRFGFEVVGRYTSERENVVEDICSIGHGATRVELDLMQPLDPQARPAVHMPPLNHIGLWIDDLPQAVAWLAASGVRFTPGGIRAGAAGHDVCFVHPKGSDEQPFGGGVLIELVQAPPDIIAALRCNDVPGAVT